MSEITYISEELVMDGNLDSAGSSLSLQEDLKESWEQRMSF